MSLLDEHKIMRRVAGMHDYRLDGLTDLLIRAQGMSVLSGGLRIDRDGASFVRGLSTVGGRRPLV